MLGTGTEIGAREDVADEAARWMMAVARAAVTGDRDALQELNGRTTAWHRVVEIAGRTRTTSVLGWAIDERLVDVPEWVHEAVDPVYHRGCWWTVQLLEELDRIADALAARGAGPVLARRGPVIRRYVEPGLRPFNDIDLIIRPEDGSALGEVLVALGYEQGRFNGREVEPLTRHERLRYVTTAKLLVPFIRVRPVSPTYEALLPVSGRALNVDLSQQFLRSELGDGPSVEDALRDAEDLHGTTIRALSPLHLFLDACGTLLVTSTSVFHIWAWRFQRVHLYLDLLTLLKRFPDLVERSEQLNAESRMMRAAVSYAMGNLGRIFGAEVTAPYAHLGIASPEDASLLDTVGFLEGREVTRWEVDLLTRLTTEVAFPAGLPKPPSLY